MFRLRKANLSEEPNVLIASSHIASSHTVLSVYENPSQKNPMKTTEHEIHLTDASGRWSDAEELIWSSEATNTHS